MHDEWKVIINLISKLLIFLILINVAAILSHAYPGTQFGLSEQFSEDDWQVHIGTQFWFSGAGESAVAIRP